MEAPSLTLDVLQGPRKGETFDFRPGSSVRIGRVVRGNTFAIKDAGISSKHLLIESESGKWTAKDLDSSNGTTVNSSLLTPLQPAELRDGDEIKLGELTSIMVRIRIEDQNQSPPRPPRRGRKKQAAASVEIKEPEARIPLEESRLETAEAEILPPSVPKRRGRKPRVPASENAEPPPPVVGRVTRSRKNELDCQTSEFVELGNPEKKKNAPARRGRRKEPPPPPENDDAVETGIKDGHELGAKLAEAAREGDADRASEVEIKPDSAMEAQEGDANRIEIKGNEGLRSNLAEETQQGDGNEAVAETEEMIQKSGSTEQQRQQQHEAPTMDSSENRGEWSGEVDLENMTLRDWLKYMEWRLTKQTVDATEKMIDEMRKKAARVEEYMIEQKA